MAITGNVASLSMGSSAPHPMYTGATASAMYIDEYQQFETIEGQCVGVTISIPEYVYIDIQEQETQHERVKKDLITALVQNMYKQNMIEFTKSQDIVSGEYIFKARVYVVPDSQVRILRVNGVIK